MFFQEDDFPGRDSSNTAAVCCSVEVHPTTAIKTALENALQALFMEEFL